MPLCFRIFYFISISWLLLSGWDAAASEVRQRLNSDTEFVIEDRGRGFALQVLISKYQFYPDMQIIAETCKSAAAIIAKEKASERKIKGKLNIDSRIETGRNIILGTSSCVANATFEADTVKSAAQQASTNLIYEAAMKKAVVCSTTAAMVFAATNSENASTIAVAACSRCSKEWDLYGKLATQNAKDLGLTLNSPLLEPGFCIKHATNSVIEFRAKRALTPTTPPPAIRPSRKDRSV